MTKDILARADICAIRMVGVNDKIKRLDDGQIANAGRGHGINQLWGWIVGAIGLGALLLERLS